MHASLSSSIVQMVFDFVEQRGLDGPTVLGTPRPSDLTGLSQVSGSAWLQMLDRLQRSFPEPALGLAVCGLAAPKYGGVLAYLTQHSGTLGEAVWHLFKYERLLHNLNASRHRISPTRIHLQWRVGRCHTSQLSDELLIGGLLSYIRLITDRPGLNPRRVGFIHTRPANVAPYEAFFGCPVEFDQPEGGSMDLPISAMLLRIRQHDESLQELLELQARTALQNLLSQDRYIAHVQEVIAGLMPKGSPSISRCAARLNISTRSLQRELATRQTSFQQLLDETRRDLGESLLQDPANTIVDVAIRLGYTDQAAFTRAFARWTGEPPARWRKSYLLPPGHGPAPSSNTGTAQDPP